MPQARTILDQWEVSAKELTEVVNANPSLRGILLGYLAEVKLRHMWFSDRRVSEVHKDDDHDRRKKGDLVVTYRNRPFVIEVKSLQTNSVRRLDDTWFGKAQCDASDRRTVVLPGRTRKTIETTCLLVGQFDLLAVNLFTFENQWRFIFAKNSDLPRSQYKKYTEAQRRHLLATLIDVTWPPKPPFRDEPFSLLDEFF